MDKETLVKKLEEKLKEKLPVEDKSPKEVVEEKLDDTIGSNDKMRTALELLKKVLDNCSNGRCNTMDKLVKVTEDVLNEVGDQRIVEQIKLTDEFERLKADLIGNSTISTDRPMLVNSLTSSPTLFSLEITPWTFSSLLCFI